MVVVVVDVNVNGLVDLFVGLKNYDVGVMLCEYFVKVIGGSGEVVIFDGILVVLIFECVCGCKVGFVKFLNVKFVDM